MSSISVANCVTSLTDNVVNYGKPGANQTDDHDKFITYYTVFAPPFVSTYFDILRNVDIPLGLVCGPFMKLLEQMSIKYGYSIKRLDVRVDLDDIQERLLNDSNEGLNVFLMPFTNAFGEVLGIHNSKEDGEDLDELDKAFIYSRPIGIQSEGHILCAKLPGTWPLFKFLDGFEASVWILLIMTLILLSIIQTIGEKSKPIEVFTKVWRLLSASFGHNQRRSEDSLFKNILNVSWLLSMTIMLSGFSGVLLRPFMQPLPKEVIDSWDELYLKKEVKIIAVQLSFINSYIDQYYDREQMARHFADRVVPAEEVMVQPFEKYNQLISTRWKDYWTQRDYLHKQNDTGKVKAFNQAFDDQIAKIMGMIESGEYVFSAQDYQLESMVMIWAKQIGTNVHISKSGGGVSPYFLAIHPNQNCPELEADLNQLIIQLIESGVYDHWLSHRVYDPSGQIMDGLRQIDTNMDWQSIMFNKMIGVFCLWSFGIAFSVVTFLIQIKIDFLLVHAIYKIYT